MDLGRILYVNVNVKYARGMIETFSIAELAAEFAVTARTIRHYEDEGLLSPLRDGQRRIYRHRDRTRLKLILRGRRLGFALAEVREILELYSDDQGEAEQLHFLIGKIAARRVALEGKREDIEASLLDLDVAEENCHKRLRQLEKAAGGARGDERQGVLGL